MNIGYDIALRWMENTSLTTSQDWNIGSGNVLVPSGNKPFHGPLFIRHMASLGRNELNII